MASLKIGDRVEHVKEASHGFGIVAFVNEVAGIRTAYVVWNGTTNPNPFADCCSIHPDRVTDCSSVPYPNRSVHPN